MRVLWLSATQSLYQSKTSSFNGGGWIASLQKAVERLIPEITLGICFVFSTKETKQQEGNVIYYPILEKKKSSIKKVLYYWGGYKTDAVSYNKEIVEVIQDFNPDVIQLFGLESDFASILGATKAPTVVHLQGILNMCYNAFYPQGMNVYTFLFKQLSLNEWILNNGFRFAVNNLKYRSKKEIALFNNASVFMGRTDCDYQISQFLSPKSEYFHVDEILRDEFYTDPPINLSTDKFVITSTISQVAYKGLDLILKTAQLLTKHTDLKFEWRIIGVDEGSKYVRFFEKSCRIISRSVHIKYMGNLRVNQVCENLHQSHVYVHPSYIDNSPNSLCEAQLTGLPSIGTYVGGVPSLITHKENGILVPANAPYETAYWLLHLYHNPDEMMSMGKRARETALARHSKEKIAKDLKSVYEKLINRTSTNSH